MYAFQCGIIARVNSSPFGKSETQSVAVARP